MKIIRIILENIYVNTKYRLVENFILLLTIVFNLFTIIKKRDFKNALRAFIDFGQKENIIEKYLCVAYKDQHKLQNFKNAIKFFFNPKNFIWILFLLFSINLSAQKKDSTTAKKVFYCIGFTKHNARCKHKVHQDNTYCFQHTASNILR